MTWADMGRNNLLAAKRMCKSHPRSAVSRAYYAAHVILTDALINAGYVPRAPYETAPHKEQVTLVNQHMAAQGRDVGFIRNLGLAISRLYRRRLEADYSLLAPVTADNAKEAIRDSVMIFSLLKVPVKL